MTEFLLIALIIALVLGLYLWRSQRKWGETSSNKKGGSAKPSGKDPNALNLENMQPGGVVRLRNVGEDMEEYDVTITGRHLYKEGSYTWHELEGDNGQQKVWIDIEEDDETEASLTLRKLRMEDLPISKKDLDKFDDEEEGKFEFEGKTYYYDESDKANFYRHGDTSQGEPFYYWDFEREDEKAYISIEKWDSGETEVYYSEPLKKSQVEVYSLKSQENE